MCTHPCLAVAFCRELQFFGDADDDTGFKYEFNGKNVTLLSNKTMAFCFSHQVGCVEYSFHVMQTEGASPRSILAFVAPERAARKAEVSVLPVFKQIEGA